MHRTAHTSLRSLHQTCRKRRNDRSSRSVDAQSAMQVAQEIPFHGSSMPTTIRKLDDTWRQLRASAAQSLLPTSLAGPNPSEHTQRQKATTMDEQFRIRSAREDDQKHFKTSKVLDSASYAQSNRRFWKTHRRRPCACPSWPSAGTWPAPWRRCPTKMPRLSINLAPSFPPPNAADPVRQTRRV